MDIRRLLFGNSRYRVARWVGVCGYAIFFLIGYYILEHEIFGVGLFVFLFFSPLVVATLVSAYRGGMVACLVVGLVPAVILSMLVLSDAVLDGSLGPPPAVALVAFVAAVLWGVLLAFGGFVLGSLGGLLRNRWSSYETSG